MIVKIRKGFTLLEVMIVVIIIGVLASLAMPRFFSTVEYARGVEAMYAIATIRGSMERCYMMRVSYTGPCANFTSLDVENPGFTPGSHFTYSVTPADTAYTIIATRNTRAGGDGFSELWLNFDGSSVFRGGTGNFGAVQ